MNFHLLSPHFSSLAISSFPLYPLVDKEEKNNEPSYSLLSHSFPCFSIEDQLLNFFGKYYQEHPEEKSTSPYLIQLDIKKFNQDPLGFAVINFLNQKRELESSFHSFNFQELLKFTEADEVEWIGSSLNEFLAPYFRELFFKH